MTAATVTNVDDLPFLITKTQFRELLGINVMKADAIMKEPNFPLFKHKNIVRIPRQELLAWLTANYGKQETVER